MYEYQVNILRVVDGDTVDVDIDLGFGIWLRNERVRLIGIDTPESRTTDPKEKIFGLASKARLKELLGKQSILKTKVSKTGEDMKGKFGRILGDFLVGEKLAGQILVEEYHAVAYNGQNKSDIHPEHIINRQRLVEQGKVKL